MGRELKRVPLDFNWPLKSSDGKDVLWKGYVCPYRSIKCPCCDQSGVNAATKALRDSWYNLAGPYDWKWVSANRRYDNNAWSNHITEVEVEALVKGGRLSDLMDKWYSYDEKKDQWSYTTRKGNKVRNIKCKRPVMPTAEAVNEWNRKGMGHDSINQWICVEARARHLGVFGNCEFCNGEGEIWHSDEVKKLSDEWKGYDPPEGPGYQLWSTTTEGHPMSPVFDTLEGLCKHLADSGASVFGSNTASYEQWMQQLSDGHVFHQEGNMIFI